MSLTPCPACARPLQLSAEVAGRAVACPACKHRFTAPAAELLLTTADTVPGRTVAAVLGLVCGLVVHSVRDAWGRTDPGPLGEEREAARQQALATLQARARALDAHAVIGLRFECSQLAEAVAEILAYGTAVRLSPSAGP